ncbi:hypothetical protein CVIRNUC_008792 [Coccomyxa viridis]|uniref:Uncharacterized protein n=1 Tax=Coccomyxa viridis TaxID=1274662 RepID=A0AAV1IEG3_9CHLO|nr:hypothetical protein CVIRNUC_008792 [Coccomyxa viridis]
MSGWEQCEVSLKPKPRGCHLVTSEVTKHLEGLLRKYRVGLCNVFLQHTSASLTINENADPDVRHDMETFLNTTVPEGRKAPWIHTAEGDDDMPAHAKSSMFGCSLDIPISNGRLNLGTWQGIYLCEHRDRASSRRIVVTCHGDTSR